MGKEAVIDVFTNKPWLDGTKDENRAARQNRAAAPCRRWRRRRC